MTPLAGRLTPLAALVGLVVLAACRPEEAPAPRPHTELASRTELALLEGELPMVRAEIPGTGGAVLMVDTGSEYTVLSERFARAHALPLEPFEARAGPSSAPGLPIENVALVREMRLGTALVRDVRVAVIDLAGLPWLADADGILGQDLLRTWFVVFDGPGRRLVLLPRCTLEEGFAQLFDGGVGAARFDPDWRLGIPLLPCTLAGAGDVELLLDTGANFLCLPPATIEALELPYLRTETASTLDGTEERDVYELPRTRIGALTIWGDVQAWERGVLGWSALRGLVLVQDGATGLVYVLENPPWK
jgi:predicted aspartyl protease